MKSMKDNILITLAILLMFGCSQKSPEELFQSAKLNAESGNYSEAVVDLKNLIAQDFTAAEARALLGQIYLKLSEFDAAEKELRRAADMGAKDIEVYPYLAKTLYYQEDFSGLIDLEQNKGTGFDPQAKETLKLLSYLSQVRLSQDDVSQVPQPELADTFNATLADAYRLFIKGETEQANEKLESLTTPHENEAELYFLNGLVKDQLGQLKDTAANYERLMEIYPNYHLGRLLLIDVLVRDNELESADMHVSMLMALDPEQPTVNFYKGAIEFLEKNYSVSYGHAQKAKEGGVQDYRNEMVHGLSSLKLGNLEQAYASLAKAAAQLPKNHSVHRLLTQLQFNLGNGSAALETLNALEGSSDLDVILHENAANLFAAQQNFEKASQQMNRVNTLSGSSLNAERLLKEGLTKIAINDFSGASQIEQSIEMDPSVVQKWLLLAEVYMDQGETDKALTLAKQLSKEDEPSGLVLEGQIYSRLGQQDKANDLYQAALANTPDHVPATNNLISSYMKAQEFDKARAWVTKALDANPDNKLAGAQLVRIASKQGFKQQDVEYLTRLSEQHPETDTPLVILASWLREKGDSAAAIDILRSNKAKLSDSGLMSLGDALYNNDNLEEAKDIYLEWAEAYPNQVMPILRLVAVYTRLGDGARLSPLLDNAAQRYPNVESIRLARLQNLVRIKSFTAAQQEFNYLISQGSNNIVLSKVKGQLAVAAKRYGQAIAPLSEYYAASNNLGDAVNLALAYLGNGQKNKASELLLAHLEKTGNTPIATMTVAEFMLTNQFYQQAVELYRQLIKFQPKNVIAQNNLAIAYIGNNQAAEALSAAQTAIELAPQEPQVMDTYGWALYKNGSQTEAEQMLAVAHQAQNANPGIALHYAEVLIAQNKKQLATRVINQTNPITLAQAEHLEKLKIELATLQ
ncbi:XrtA/PEP-CTERM system TPR-repeat protein PrsT [Glaciecola siphonariae]|uniref:XrtA/PEP-CTERM system TPR-repeat protein PrsT n=1 Tax=Glaciecola siphonariae TaxID=521012 RepID=A0ABV9LUE1_9ALTE